MFLERKESVILGDTEYRFRNDFRIYLRVQRVLACPDIFDDDKLEVVCGILFIDEIPPEIRWDVVMAFIKMYAGDKPSGMKCMDMEQDANLIYAGFFQMYNIDLNTAELSIEEFIALFSGFSRDTRLMEVIRIRTMPIPKPTKENSNQINAILRAKSEVALKDKGSIGKGLTSLARMVRSMANGR